jgi:hypothetical protein
MSAVDKIAAERPGIDPFGQMIRKANQHTFSKCFSIEFVDFFIDVQALVTGNLDELFEDRSDLLGDGIANAKPACFIRAMLLSVKPGAD